MRRDTLVRSSQHTLPFERRAIWESLPVEQRRQCADLCRQLLRAVMEDGERLSGEGQSDEREDPRRAF
jgi:hypothetical protein